MIKQNDKNCLAVINRIGCFVRSCGAMAEFVSGKELTAQQINELWQWGKKSGNINAQDIVKHSAPIATKALQLLEASGKFVEVATFANGKIGYYASVTDNLKVAPKYYIQKIKTYGSEGTHFRNVDYKGEVIFDPYEPAVNPAGIFYTIIYAYVNNKKEN